MNDEMPPLELHPARFVIPGWVCKLAAGTACVVYQPNPFSLRFAAILAVWFLLGKALLATGRVSP